MDTTRRHPRTNSVSFLVEVLGYSACFSTQDEGRLVVLGAGGAFLELSGRYPLGSMLRVNFKLPSTLVPVTCSAIVRFRLEGKGVGVEFWNLEPHDQKRIGTFVRQQLSE